jgi:WD40 repeat protein
LNQPRRQKYLFFMMVTVGGKQFRAALIFQVACAAATEGLIGCLAVEPTAPSGAPSGVADPTRLPVASGQVPNVVAYTALNMPSQPAGFSYLDPVTGVRVWKVTSSSIPTTNSDAGHDYSDGPNEVSLGWGPNNNTHTILIGAPQGEARYYLVDFTRGVGFTNYRRLTVQPMHDLGFTFSNLSGQPRIAYIMTATQIVRYNTATMRVENTGNFPLNHDLVAWLQHDRHDEWFVGLVDDTTAFAWNSRTNQLLTHAESWLNEPRLERDGRYIALTNGNNTFRLWDLATNTFGPTQTDALNFWLGHNANLRGQWVTTDVNASAPFDLDRYYPSGGQIGKTRFLNNSAGSAVHHSGNWVQSDDELGHDLNKQWSFVSGVDNSAFTAAALWKQAIGVVRSDGSDARLLAGHYSVNPGYWGDPFAQPSPDGKVVIFDSNMNGSTRYDLFVVEMPLR